MLDWYLDKANDESLPTEERDMYYKMAQKFMDKDQLAEDKARIEAERKAAAAKAEDEDGCEGCKI